MKSIVLQRLSRLALPAALLATFPLTSNAVVSPAPARVTPTPASKAAADATPNPPALASLSAAAQAQRLANLKTRGDTEISRRLSNLNNALAKVQTVTTLSTADKAALVGQIQAEISGLNTTKSKLDTDTTLATARTDVQTIVTDYRVYALMLPKARLTATFDQLAVVETKLNKLANQLGAAINSAKASGKDVTATQASLADMQAKIAAIATLTDGQVAKLLALQPSDYNTDHTVLESYRTTLVTAQTDAKAAASDASSIIQGLGSGKAASPSASPSAK